jgi:hypothetical protein
MSGSVPRLPWPRAVLALAAAVCLIAATSALAADPLRLSGAPLWDAYPIDGATPATTVQKGTTTPERTPAEPATTPQREPQAQAPAQDPLLHTNVAPIAATPVKQADRKVAPAVVVLFFIAIATLLTSTCVLALRQVRRTRPPRPARG